MHPFIEPDQGTSEGFNLVLMDHDPKQYLTDLLALEKEELLCPSGCSVILIHRDRRAESLREIVDYIRAKPDCYCIKTELQFMTEVLFQKESTEVKVEQKV